ncbi:isopenicillin N synthase family oxygenase [Oculatella sp. LEGE 06141]|uniref:isopenicillin N synthase family oxygenase n=1 Tax=Oculatella sp. LEGE 06141 TaxID=1828648 RepID=UPI001880A2E1|nr:isopenicillin N synthase family oxygenase [Oculatella sp. LEGE 06141]MBE9177795.1 isopenicillin N synthase family oxygenase [Oculatella sp. LEGE 06141]
MKTTTHIPTLPDPTVYQADFAQHLQHSLAQVGAAYVPVSPSIDDGALLGSLRSFFGLNEWQKRSLAQRLASPWQGVYIALGEEQLSDDQEDYKEVLDLNLENGTYAQWVKTLKDRRSNQERGNSISPESLVDQKELTRVSELLCQVFYAFQKQANEVLTAIETAYEQPGGSLVERHGKNSTLRLLHYPPAPHFNVGSIRLGAHQDYSGITLLWQDATGGLEILTPNREWISIDIPPGCIGIIASEVMQRWSGDTLHAAPHRVRVTNPQQLQKTRYSIAFFCETNHDCVVHPGSLLREANIRAEEPIAIKSFLSKKYDQILSNLNV